MDEKGSDSSDRIDDVIMPGFRFHPTDEELVGFYLKRKIQQRLLPIELIKQVDIYKYDPWDLPKLASSGEKEWYFYCPRDRKYRNSARPNRVTGAGFWKATGTDRPIYSSDGTKCIGLKKSLVFYRGRAAKGIKTDWMMHEFRLPSTTTNNSVNDAVSTPPTKKFSDKSPPLHDAWAICRIFKKTNSLAQRALSHAWIASLPETPSPDMFPQYTQYSSENISCTTETGSAFSSLNIPSSKPQNGQFFKQDFSQNGDNINVPTNFIYSQPDKCGMDVASMLFNSIDSEGSQQQHFNGFSIGSSSSPEMQDERKDDGQWGYMRSMGFPFNLPNNLPWDSPDCPSSEISTATYSNKCYT